MFLTIKKKWILIFLSFLLVVASVVVYFTAIKPTFIPKPERVIVIDAGHGGIDGGCVGKSEGAVESELNLAYAKELEKICLASGFKVVMTRKDSDGLYSLFAQNKKKSEMKKREEIINASHGDLLISIHMNSSPVRSIKGAQVFYKIGSDYGKEFADEVTKSLKENLDCIRSSSKEGDFYVLNCNDKPSILLECGFLSNADEEKLIMQTDYRQKFCEAVFFGILNYLKF